LSLCKKSIYVVNKNARHELEGNFGEKVMATDLLKMAKNHLEGLMKIAPTMEVFNVGSGAKLAGAVELKPEEIFTKDKLDKESIVEDIKTSFFKDLAFTNIEPLLGVEQFEEMCEHLVEIAERPIATRKEAAELLKRQSRYVYSFKGTKFEHLFNMLKGSLLYYHCPLITLLYTFEDEEKTLEIFSGALDLWSRYILEIKEDFKKNWHTKCDWGLAERNLEREFAKKLKEDSHAE